MSNPNQIPGVPGGEGQIPSRRSIHGDAPGTQQAPSDQAPSSQPRPPQRKPGNMPMPVATKKKTGVGRSILIALSIVLVLALGAGATLGWFFWRLTSTYNNQSETIVDAFPLEETRPVEREDAAQTILLLGSDTRWNIDDEHLEGAQSGRSDTIMVMRIPADRDGIYILSIMRDSWVEIPGYGPSKINAAFAYGGTPLAIETVEDLLDTRIDHVAVVDFTTFKGLTDAVGGVTVNNTRDFNAGGFHFEQGQITLNGEEALAFVRERKTFLDGDYQRVRNQQAYMKGLLSELLSRDTLTSPARLQQVVEEVSPYIARDEGLNAGYLVSLAPSLHNLRANNIHFLSAPTTGVGTSADGQSIINLDFEKMEEVRLAFEHDTLQDLVE